MAEFLMGFQARLSGLFAIDCPFPDGSAEALSWIEGWTDRATIWMVSADELPTINSSGGPLGSRKAEEWR